ncbi:MAG: hypothetical protein EXR67_04720 [Dehalococcoidia bacterium]|nr:hypothetical protein [Dehalococcoidia bacterium]
MAGLKAFEKEHPIVFWILAAVFSLMLLAMLLSAFNPTARDINAAVQQEVTRQVNALPRQTQGPQGASGLQGPKGDKGERGDPFMVISSPTPTANNRIADGVWRVGVDVQPGLYQTATSGCYWARLRNFSDNSGEILGNGNTPGPTVVRILTTDAGFQSSRCIAWVRVGD